MDWIGSVLLCFFLLLGILVGLRKLLYMILGDNSGTLCLTLYFCGHVENAEQQLRSALEELRWMEGRRKKILLCIDDGMDEETRRICRYFARDYPVCRIVTPQELPSAKTAIL